MSPTIHARLFESQADAAAAIRDLEIAGFTGDEVILMPSQTATGGIPNAPSLGASGMQEHLSTLGAPESDANAWAEALRQGGSLVVIRADGERGERAGTILSNHLAVQSEAHEDLASGPDDEGTAVLSAPAPGTPGNPPGS